MIMENLSKILKHQAIERNLCAQWTKEWSDDCDRQALIDKYKAGLDFIIKQGQWPANEFIKANFDRELLHTNLIFVDEHIDIKDAPNGIYVINGECDGVLQFNGWAAATVYVRHSSNITVVADDFAKVFVRIYDDANAEVVSLSDAVVKVYDRRG